MTGEDFYTQMHIELALEQCSVFVSLNTTFQQKEPNVTYTIESRCPNNCSGHGMCYNGGISLVISIFTFTWTHFFWRFLHNQFMLLPMLYSNSYCCNISHRFVKWTLF